MCLPICPCRSGGCRPWAWRRSLRSGSTGTQRRGRFTIEFEERWQHEGQRWYCREMIRADVVDDSITELSIYCTGDWDEARQQEHRKAVTLIRP
jgi:hypothetical protein